jgi:hypothetical protein
MFPMQESQNKLCPELTYSGTNSDASKIPSKFQTVNSGDTKGKIQIGKYCQKIDFKNKLGNK